jgi:glycosyltransferase involved in cell wall biosynthesis
MKIMSEKKLHILQLPSWYLPHGGQFVKHQTRILKEKGLNVHVLANVDIALTLDKAKYVTYPYRPFVSDEDGLTVFRHYFRDLPKLRKINTKLWIKNTVKLFGKYQKLFGKPDIIHVHSSIWGGYAAYLIKKKYGIPYVITEHRGRFGQSCDYAKSFFASWQTPLLEKVFSEAAHIIPVSENLIPSISSFLTQKVPVTPISNVLDTDFFHYKPRETSEKIRFVTTNSFDHAKAYDILLPAFDKACMENPKLELCIVGGKFEGNQVFNKVWKSVKNTDNFRFTGFLNAEEVRGELWNADAFVLASRIEAQPIAVLEALSTGLPVVCTTVVPKAIARSENSLVIPVENVDMLKDAIIEMANNFQNYDGKAISEHINSICGKEAFAKAIIDIYRQALKK